MSKIINYLTFNGNCREAMDYYGNCFGALPMYMTFGESPMAEQTPKQYLNNIMHSNLIKDDFIIYAADTMPNQEVTAGTMISLNLECKTEEEINNYYEAFAKESKIVMPLQDTFWGARFAMIVDKFGIPWMFNYEFPKK
jgi:PhnB protein